MAGLYFIIFITLMATLAPVLAPADPITQDLSKRLAPMGSSSNITRNGKYILGADQFGRDILSRIIYGARISLTKPKL